MDQNLRTRTPKNETPPAPGQPSQPDLEQDAARGKALLAAGAEIIANALSTDTEAFLRASRQHGGE